MASVARFEELELFGESGSLYPLLTGFSQALLERREVPEFLHELGRDLLGTAGTAGVAISLVGRGHLVAAVTEGEAARVMESIQQSAHRGPRFDAHRSGRPLHVADLGLEYERWPEVAGAARTAGVGSLAAIPLLVSDFSLGVLDVYRRARRDWSPVDRLQIQLVADLAAGFLNNSQETARLQRRAGQLEEALQDRLVIEQAKGLLAGRRHISLDAAFRAMRNYARSHNVLLRSVAKAIIDDELRL